jgi:hypothetical protein
MGPDFFGNYTFDEWPSFFVRHGFLIVHADGAEGKVTITVAGRGFLRFWGGRRILMYQVGSMSKDFCR